VLFKFDDVAIKALPAQHISFARTDTGSAGGQPLSYIIDTEDGETVFFAGDTSIHGDLKLYGELYHPLVGMLGVGGVDVHGQSLTELHPDEAVLAAKWLGLEMAIPMHYRGDEGKAFVDELEKLAPNIEGLLMKPGDRYMYHSD
jgi:L-ascorbate metabolism protein UlaG (beta-lactamase superfamily)